MQQALGIASKPVEGEDYCKGVYKGVTVITVATNVGLAAAQAATETLLSRYGSTLEHIFVVGTTSAFDLRLKVGEVVVPESVMDERDGIARRPVNLGLREPAGVIYSTDQQYCEADYVAILNNRNVASVDAISGAVSAACEQHGCPFTVVKAVSDTMDLLAEPHDLFHLAGMPDCRSALRFALRRPHRIAYLIGLALGAKKAIAASCEELLINIENLLQQPAPIERTDRDREVLARAREG
jgi:nucleoside phosphorylase